MTFGSLHMYAVGSWVDGSGWTDALKLLHHTGKAESCFRATYRE